MPSLAGTFLAKYQVKRSDPQRSTVCPVPDHFPTWWQHYKPGDPWHRQEQFTLTLKANMGATKRPQVPHRMNETQSALGPRR